MKKAIFCLLLLFSASVAGEFNHSDLKELYGFIRKHSNQTKVSPRTAFPNHDSAKVNREANLLRLDYDGFTIWLDCAKRGAVKFAHRASRDMGRLPRYKKYHLDPAVPEYCQQTSFRGYGNSYDRGHLGACPRTRLSNKLT